ncbi:MAG: GFA family protein [Desulfuromonadaceae bacterium]|nr:GFA family protein [Desulfuromonadaceae bacterium]
MLLSIKNKLGPQYASLDDAAFIPKHRAACFCGRIRYEVSAEPVDAKLCHCSGCQKLHGAPMQWAAIFHKHHVRFTAGLDLLRFYTSEQDLHARILPCKVSCNQCGTPIADEGRRMWLAFPTLFDFGLDGKIPDSFKPTCHLFYGQRVLDICDNLPKWSGHKNQSARL